jgi:hypothetical protein
VVLISIVGWAGPFAKVQPSTLRSTILIRSPSAVLVVFDKLEMSLSLRLPLSSSSCLGLE